MSEPLPSRTRRSVVLDAVCRDAVDQARAAATALSPAEHVGEHLGVTAEGERVADAVLAGRLAEQPLSGPGEQE